MNVLFSRCVRLCCWSARDPPPQSTMHMLVSGQAQLAVAPISIDEGFANSFGEGPDDDDDRQSSASDSDDDDDSKRGSTDVSSASDCDSDDSMEDELPAPILPDSESLGAAIPAVSDESPPLAPKPIGRPKQVIDMSAPLFTNLNKTNIGDFMHAVHEVLSRNNTSEALGKELHAVFQRLVNPNLPSYLMTVKVLRDSTNKPKIYPACPNDCYVHDVSMDELSEAVLGKMRCRHCQADFAGQDKKPKKVSYYPGCTRQRG
ncbi:MAG: hypothetical protein Q7T57_05545 [Dehalococcoidales bacterium]|nr:hypothetical protein [Dehalococcoidales bacterium]